ncbi:MAG TPA: hypothetical protein VMW42_12185, partial [Desulfatiglandales bacterium]|nr:hypothetical protein [Desulfatiglandales bacterium]
LMPFEKHLPSTSVKKLLVTLELVEDPEKVLKWIDDHKDVGGSYMDERFQRAAENEKERIKKTILERASELELESGLKLYEERINLIAEQTLKLISDIDSAFKDFQEMYNQVKTKNEELFSKLGIDVRLSDSAIDEIIRISIMQDRDIEEICIKFANELEYGLKLVRDRIGFEAFTVTREAVLDPENYIDGLIKKYYSQDPVIS